MTDETEADHSETTALAVAIEALESAAETVRTTVAYTNMARELQEKMVELTGTLFTKVDQAHAALEAGRPDKARAILEPFALARPAAPSPLPSVI